MALKILPSMLVWCLAAAALAWQWCPLTAVVAASVVGTATGVAVAWALAARRVRLPLLWAGALLVLGGGLGLASLLRQARWASQLVGGGNLYQGTEATLWLLGALAVAAAARSTGLRHRAGVVGEAAFVCLALLGLFSAHRDGYLSRPHALVDPLWSRGYDPLPVFLAIGAAVAVACVLLAAGHARQHRRDLVWLCLLIAGFYLVFPTSLARRLPGMAVQDLRDHKQRGNPPVAVVVFRDDYTPPSGTYFFRQTVASRFDGLQLVAASSAGVDTDLLSRWPRTSVAVPLPAVDRPLFKTLRTRLALLAPQDRPFALDDPASVTAIGNPDPSRFVSAFAVRSRVFVGHLQDLVAHSAGDPRWSRRLWTRYTRAPGDPRYALRLAAILKAIPAADRHDPFKVAVAIKLWLEQHGTYSLASQAPRGPRAVSEFLFGKLTGPSNLFARAACELMRSAGLPARLAQGYAVSAQQRGNGSALLINASAASAWAELYHDGVGWVPIDVQPVRTLVAPGNPPDTAQQQMLGDLARQNPRQGRSALGPAATRDLQRVLLRRLEGLLLPVLGALLAWLYGVKLWRRLAHRVVPPGTIPWATYRGALDRLAEQGLVRERGESREAFAARCAEVAPSFGELTRVFLESALGARPPLERAHYVGLLSRLERDLARRRLDQRLLGALDPLAWRRSR